MGKLQNEFFIDKKIWLDNLISNEIRTVYSLARGSHLSSSRYRLRRWQCGCRRHDPPRFPRIVLRDRERFVSRRKEQERASGPKIALTPLPLVTPFDLTFPPSILYPTPLIL
jgi:hypothetical protein